MAKVLRNIDQVFHFWANAVQFEGECGNVFFSDGRIYSYGRHFCIARILPSGAVAITTRGYSNSTARHVSKARSAARHMSTVFCYDPAESARVNMQHARESIRDALNSADKPRIRQTTRDGFKAQALRLAEHANAYLAALPEDERGVETPVDISALESVRDALIAADAAAEKIREEQRNARLADMQDSLAKWRKGEIYLRTGLHELAPALRIVERDDGTVIQTSHGAEIPLDHARRFWPIVQRVRAAATEWVPSSEKSYRLGPYSLNKIRPDGSIIVGCHDIAYSELHAIAVELGMTGA